MQGETRHGISRGRLEQLIRELRAAAGVDVREASQLISAAGLTGDTWLIQCLMYESDAAIWAAWEVPE